jgi:hypothetical protein
MRKELLKHDIISCDKRKKGARGMPGAVDRCITRISFNQCFRFHPETGKGSVGSTMEPTGRGLTVKRSSLASK